MTSIIARTARLTLRRLDMEDADFLLELLNEPLFLRYIGDKGVRSSADAREYLRCGPLLSYARNGFGLYAVQLAAGVRAGICGLVKREGLEDVDIGFALLERHCRRGYAFEAAVATVEHARRDLHLQRLVAITDPANAASIAVLKKIGLKFERLLRLAAQSAEVNLYAITLNGGAHGD